MSALRSLSPSSKLSLFVVILLVVVIFTAISFSLRQQKLIGKALSVSESAKSQCNEKGEAEIVVKFSNMETNSLMAMSVSVKDVQTGLTTDLGKVAPSKTGTAAIQTNRTQIDGSSVIFYLSLKNNASGAEDQRGATYAQVVCGGANDDSPLQTTIPTPTVEVESTYFNLSVVLDGIGVGGNQNPVHKAREVKIEVLNSKNELVASKSGDLNYASGFGYFAGKIDMGNSLKDGLYMIKVKVDGYLGDKLKRPVSVRAEKINRIGVFDLAVGDMNNDGEINILDFNLLGDLNDDGVVNKLDYNLFLRELE
jgi:hypothetical protein